MLESSYLVTPREEEGGVRLNAGGAWFMPEEDGYKPKYCGYIMEDPYHLFFQISRRVKFSFPGFTGFIL